MVLVSREWCLWSWLGTSQEEVWAGMAMDGFNSYICSFFFSTRMRRTDDTLGTGSVLKACCIR